MLYSARAFYALQEVAVPGGLQLGAGVDLFVASERVFFGREAIGMYGLAATAAWQPPVIGGPRVEVRPGIYSIRVPTEAGRRSRTGQATTFSVDTPLAGPVRLNIGYVVGRRVAGVRPDGVNVSLRWRP